MTKVDVSFRLSRPLADNELKSISRVHAVYGMLVVRVLPSGEELFVEYDASRLSSKEARAVLEQHGIPLV
ncbi:MAG: hypothetical protein JO091_05525 [Acidobacteriaceae bacterium]|nr:hypothetical protein [Acidobacteriaceae bacterium]